MLAQATGIAEKCVMRLCGVRGCQQCGCGGSLDLPKQKTDDPGHFPGVGDSGAAGTEPGTNDFEDDDSGDGDS